jgi:hypothetical protein
MKIEFRQFTLTDVLNNSASKRRYIEGFKKYFEDPEKTQRIQDQNCIYCYYSGKIGGAAMTTCYCGLCKKEMIFGTTSTDALCRDCAKNHNLCKHCGADMEYKQRRKI